MILRFAMLAIAIFLLPLQSNADTVYSYVGPDFTLVAAPYTTSDHVTLTFTVPGLLLNIG